MYQCDTRSSERWCHLGDEVGLSGDGIDLHLQKLFVKNANTAEYMAIDDRDR